jgi:SAM-dependent methyltransferase
MKRCPTCAAAFDGEWSCPSCGFVPGMIEGFRAFAPAMAVGDAGNPTDFTALAAVEAGNFWFRARNRLIAWAIQRYFPDAKSMLEIGCGTGFVLSGIRRSLPGLKLSGSEASCAGLAFALSRVPDASLFQMDARSIPFVDEFDVVGAFDVIEHIKEDEQVLAEMHRATRKGGGIVLAVPQHPFLWSRVDENAGHVRRYGARELADKVARAGFKVTRRTSFVSVLLPLMMASRLARKSGDGRKTADAEFAVGPVVNATMEGLLALERGLIRFGVSFPAGGSLLLVAHKQ